MNIGVRSPLNSVHDQALREDQAFRFRTSEADG